MGIDWSKPKPVRNGASIMFSTTFPSNSVLRNKLWNLWKHNKAALKEDGFRIKKWNEVWKIAHFQNVTPASYERSESNELQYITDFKALYAKWNSIYEMVPTFSEREDSGEDDSPWFIEDDQ